MMEQLQLKQIVGYLPYGLKCISQVENLGVETIKGFEIYSSGIELITNIDNLHILESKPILFPISSLTELREDLGFVPMVELAKIANLDITKYDISKTNNAYGIRCNIENDEDSDTHEVLGFDMANGFGHHYRPSKTWTMVNNQFELWQKLYEWKIDIHNLIEKGLAIKVTEEFNPYL
jgi:hypothetical protein